MIFKRKKEDEKVTREEINKDKQKEINEEVNKEKRRKWIIFGFKSMFMIIALMMGFYFFAMHIETKRLVVRETRITNERIPESFNSSKIIHFSDLHYGTTIGLSELNDLVYLINLRNPDIIVFTGDLIDIEHPISTEEQEEVISILKQLEATLGKYAISGDEDSYDQFQTIMNQSGFTILNNDYDFIYNGDNHPILLVGLATLLGEKRDIDAAFYEVKNYTENFYTILLMHETDGLDDILNRHHIDLVLAGHSHHGQIRIPGLPPLGRKNGSRVYHDAVYQVGNTQIFISSGIGSNDSGFRLFARPSINFFRLTSG